jgi:hypothetical protein
VFVNVMVSRNAHDGLTDFPGYLFRVLPVFGRLYISRDYLCFKSSGTLTSKTRVRLGWLATDRRLNFSSDDSSHT